MKQAHMWREKVLKPEKLHLCLPRLKDYGNFPWDDGTTAKKLCFTFTAEIEFEISLPYAYMLGWWLCKQRRRARKILFRFYGVMMDTTCYFIILPSRSIAFTPFSSPVFLLLLNVQSPRHKGRLVCHSPEKMRGFSNNAECKWTRANMKTAHKKRSLCYVAHQLGGPVESGHEELQQPEKYSSKLNFLCPHMPPVNRRKNVEIVVESKECWCGWKRIVIWHISEVASGSIKKCEFNVSARWICELKSWSFEIEKLLSIVRDDSLGCECLCLCGTRELLQHHTIYFAELFHCFPSLSVSRENIFTFLWTEREEKKNEREMKSSQWKS